MIKILHLVLFLFLSACSTLTPPSSKPLDLSWKERQQALEQFKSWQLQGVIAVQTPSDNGSANLTWKQNAQTYTISLFGPLGSNAVQIQGKPGLVILQTAQGQSSHAANPEQLLYNQLGWKLPVSHLYYWARGLPVPTLPAEQAFDNHHRLIKLTQQNWQLWFKQYAVFHQKELPTKIILRHPQLNIKIVIYQWEI